MVKLHENTFSLTSIFSLTQFPIAWYNIVRQIEHTR